MSLWEGALMSVLRGSLPRSLQRLALAAFDFFGTLVDRDVILEGSRRRAALFGPSSLAIFLPGQKLVPAVILLGDAVRDEAIVRHMADGHANAFQRQQADELLG